MITSIALGLPVPGHAQATIDATGGEQSVATVSRPFRVPPQALASALTAWAAQSGVRVSVDGALLSGLRSPGVTGSLAPEDALARLLAGSGLTWRRIDAGTVRVERAPPVGGDAIALGPVRVEGTGEVAGSGAATVPTAVLGNLPDSYAGGQVARGAQLGLLGNQDFTETPFSVTAFTEQTLRDLNTTRVLDVLLLDPSVINLVTAADPTLEFQIRGFSNYRGSNVTLDGLPGIAEGDGFDGIFYERIELLKGPSSLLTAGGAVNEVGGIVNLVPKLAGDVPLTRLTAAYAERSEFGAYLDAGRRFGSNGQFGVRVNLGYADGEQEPVETQSARRFLGSVGLDYRGDRLRAAVHYQRIDARYTPFFEGGLRLSPIINGVWQPPDSSQEPPRLFPLRDSYLDADRETILGRVEYDILPQTTISFAYGQAEASQFIRSSGFLDIDVTTGDATFFNWYFENPSESSVYNLNLRSRFSTGPVSHRVAVDATRTKALSGFFYKEAEPYSTNFFRQVAGPQPATEASPPFSFGGKRDSVALANTFGLFSDRLLFTAGARYVEVESLGADEGGRLDSIYKDSAITPSFAALFKLTDRFSLYGNYIETLSEGPRAPLIALPTAGGVSNPGEVFAPFASRQIEVGGKIDLGKLALTAALFDIERPSFFIDPTTQRFGPGGLQTNRGLELSIFGEIAPNLRVIAGYAFTDAKLSRTEDPAQEGNRAPFVPTHSATLATEWDLAAVPGLTLVSRVRAQSSQFWEAANVRKPPGFAVFGLGANYRIDSSVPVIVRAFVDNIADKRYFLGGAVRNNFAVGEPRTVTLSAEVEF